MKVSSNFKLFDNFQIDVKDSFKNDNTESIEIRSPFHEFFIAYCLESYPNLKSIIFTNRAEVINKKCNTKLNSTGL